MAFLDLTGMEFRNRKEFEDYLEDRVDIGGIKGGLKLVCTLSDFEKEDKFISALSEMDFHVVRKHGVVFHLKRGNIDFFVCRDQKYNLDIFLTDARKTHDLPPLLNFISFTPRISHLWIQPVLMMNIMDELIDRYPETTIPFFTARRTISTEIQARYRPSIERTIQYNGIDGVDTLKEMKFYYGVLPKIIEFSLPIGVRFKLDSRGIITLKQGLFSDISPIIKRIVKQILGVRDAVKKSGFKIDSIPTRTKVKFRRFLQTPWTIEIGEQIEAFRMLELLKKNEDDYFNFILSNYSKQDDNRPYLSARLVNEYRGTSIDIIYHGKKINVYPIDDVDIGISMDFFQFVTEYVDSTAVPVGG